MNNSKDYQRLELMNFIINGKIKKFEIKHNTKSQTLHIVIIKND